jgi:uncharacterized RmlC-like cupin family protein
MWSYLIIVRISHPEYPASTSVASYRLFHRRYGGMFSVPTTTPAQTHTHTGTEPIEVRAVYSQTQPQADERVHSHDQRVNWVCRVQITAPQPAEPRCAAPLGRSRSAAAAAGDCTTARLTPIEQGTCARAALSGRVGTWYGNRTHAATTRHPFPLSSA